jgi:hypothetical protein
MAELMSWSNTPNIQLPIVTTVSEIISFRAEGDIPNNPRSSQLKLQKEAATYEDSSSWDRVTDGDISSPHSNRSTLKVDIGVLVVFGLVGSSAEGTVISLPDVGSLFRTIPSSRVSPSGDRV